ncbi:uncharacterized protein LOC128210999 [Mya arenaria]|nr:uncharacterized protein LOC128210999 [Mya arenaria]
MNVSMILRICLILRVIHEVSGGFIPVESRCAKTCSRQEMGWSFNCDGDNTTCDWQCAAQRKDCPEGLTYHCAADYEDFELHTGNINYLEECALEKPCKRGEEPSITLYANGEKLPPNKARINCIPCSNKLFFNNIDGRLSSSYSRCFRQKFNKCIRERNKINCGESWLERKMTDGFCRCDARRGFAPENENIETKCFFASELCTLRKCPSTQELALNYTCISHCPDGYHRTDDSDKCVERASATAKTKTPKTASSTADQTHTQVTIATTTENEKVVVSTKKTNVLGIVIGVVLGTVVVGLIAWILMKIYWHKEIIRKEYNENGRKEAARLMVEKALCQYSSCLKSQGDSDENNQNRVNLLTHVEQEGRGVSWKRKIPSDRELWNVASLIGENWKGLGLDLGLSRVTIHHIEYDNNINGHIDVVHRMLIELRNSRPDATLNDLKEAIIRSGVDFNWGSEKNQELYDERDQNAALNDTTDEHDQNAVLNDSMDEQEPNAVFNDYTDERGQNAVLNDTTVEREPNAVFNDSTDERGQNTVLNDTTVEREPNAVFNDSTDERGRNAVLNDTTVEREPNAVFKDTTDECGQNAVLNDTTVEREPNAVFKDTTDERGRNAVLNDSTVEREPNAVFNDSTDERGRSAVLNDSTVEREPNAVLNDTTDERGRNAVLNESTVEREPNAVLNDTTDERCRSAVLNDCTVVREPNAVFNDSTDERGPNAVLNDSTDELGINAVSNDTTGDGDRNAVFIDIETNSNIDVEGDSL